MVVFLTDELVEKIRNQSRSDAIGEIHSGMVEKCGLSISLQFITDIVYKIHGATERELKNMRINGMFVLKVECL